MNHNKHLEGIPYYTVCPLIYSNKLKATFPATVRKWNFYRFHLDAKSLFQVACNPFLIYAIPCIHFFHS